MSSFPDEDYYLRSPPLNLLLLLLGLAYSCFYFLLRWCSFASPPSCSSSSLLLLFLHARASPPMARLLLLRLEGWRVHICVSSFLLLPSPAPLHWHAPASPRTARPLLPMVGTARSSTQLRFNHLGSSNQIQSSPAVNMLHPQHRHA